MKFAKYHALGNDYLVIRSLTQGSEILDSSQIQRLCHRRFGVGSDGILIGPLKSDLADFQLRIFNPDGSEAEKSGNGIRIFCRFLWDEGYVNDTPFTVETKGGIVSAEVLKGGREVQVGMGRVSFSSEKIPVLGDRREVLREEITAGDRKFQFCAATIGNPHCVILLEEISEETARKYGPLIERASIFQNRTNVQFLKVLDRRNVQIEIWERGAGYTMASGSSSCAAAAVARRLGLCDPHISVHMSGGTISISISENFDLTMRGPVVKVSNGEVDGECFA